MIKDVCLAAAHMLGREDEADALSAGDAVAWRIYLPLCNLVVSEIAEEYRRGDYDVPPAGADLSEDEAKFYGISARVLA